LSRARPYLAKHPTAQISSDLLPKYHPKWRQVALAESNNNNLQWGVASDGGDHARLYRDRDFGRPCSICPHLHGTPTVDCSVYDAGYKWAKQRDIVDDNYCPDGNKAFYEGCVAYAIGSSGTANGTDNGIGTPPLSNDDEADYD
jgi:hypothetical protein